MKEYRKLSPTLNSSHSFDNQANDNQESKIEVLQKYDPSKILKLNDIFGF